MASTQKIDSIAEAKLRQFQNERRRKFAINAVGYTLSAIAAVLLVMIVAGPAFDPILNVIGLRSIWTDKGGVYADCSKRENRNNRFCSGKVAGKETEWKKIANSPGGKAVPFELY